MVIVILIAVLLILLLLGAGYYFYKLALCVDSNKKLFMGNIEQQRSSAAQALWEQEMASWKEKKPVDIFLINQKGYQLHAFHLAQKSHFWVIDVHGYMGNAMDMIHSANHFFKTGYQVVMPDLRGHGQSDGKQIGMGYWDSDDLAEWINYIISMDQDCRIVLYGVSMGASSVLMTTGLPLPMQVRAAVEDCGYTSAWEEFTYQLKRLFKLPPFPMLYLADCYVRLFSHYRLKDADVMKRVSVSNIPTLFIHGNQDSFVPTAMVYQLYQCASCEKELLIIEGADHGHCRKIDPDRYWNHIDRWLTRFTL